MTSIGLCRAALLLASCTSMLLTGCTSVLGIDDTTLEETVAVDPTHDWTCVGKLPAPQATADEITISIVTTEFIQVEPTPLQGVSVRVCPAFDDACANGTTPVESDANGLVSINVKIPKEGFAGYLQLEKADYTTLLWQFSRKPTADFTLPVQMVSATSFAGLRNALGLPIDSQLGHLTFSVVTCGKDADGNAVPAPGVAVDVATRNPESKRFYAVGAGFESDTTQPVTAESGRGGIFNLTPAPNKLVVTLPDDPDTSLAEAGGLFIRADTISTIDMLPRLK